jgi:predicted PurR-regulated permease PerM
MVVIGLVLATYLAFLLVRATSQIFARTVKVNPLTVLIAILIAVELAGILGALLAIPIAGMIQIIVRDIWDTRRGQLKTELTVGEDKVPVDSAHPTPQPAPAPNR